MIKDGRPYTIERENKDTDLLTNHPKEEQEAVLKWIKENFISRKSKNYYYNSYGLKHILQRVTGIYLSNNEFKDAMLIAGFQPVNPNAVNWNFYISEKSPALNLHLNGIRVKS